MAGRQRQIRTAMDLRNTGHGVGSRPGESAYTGAYDRAINDGKSYENSYGRYWDGVN